MARSHEESTIQVLGRAFRIVEAVAEIGPATCTGVADWVGLTVSTTYRILSDLVKLGYISKDSKTLRYHISDKFESLYKGEGNGND